MKKIGVFTSGGDSSGMNAAIRAVVRMAHHHHIETVGIRRGYQGMIEGDFVPLDVKSVGGIIQRGGTILKTARSKDFMTTEGRLKAANNLRENGIEHIVAIGGNGTYTGAIIFNNEHNIKTIGLPGTIDNDLYGTDFTIGFDTAVEVAMDAIDKIRDTADAHNRVFFVELMGRDAGFIALNAGLATGAEAILLPEIDGDYESLIQHFSAGKREKYCHIILVAEGEKEGKAFDIMQKFKAQFTQYDCRTVVLGHIQRGGRPTANDRILATRLGAQAVQALLDGKYNVTLGIVNGNIQYTPFDEAVQKCKNVEPNLWKLAQILSL